MKANQTHAGISPAIISRIAAGKDFDAIVEMLDLKTTDDPAYKARLMELLTELLGPPPAVPSQVYVMNAAKAHMFGLKEIDYGKAHRGDTHDKVYETDPDYLRWIADEGLLLGAYLRYKDQLVLKKES